MEHKRSFLEMRNTGAVMFINLDLIRMIDELRPGHCQIWFSETHKVTLHGDAFDFFMARIGDRAINFEGELLDLNTPPLPDPAS